MIAIKLYDRRKEIVCNIVIGLDKKQSIIIFCILVTAAAVIYGVINRPTGETPESSYITVTDCLDRTIIIEEPVEKIMFTGRGNSLTLSVVYLFESAPEKIYGLTESFAESTLFSVVDPNIDDKILEGISDMGVEEIAAQEPDVVVLKSYLKTDVGDPLESLGINVVYLDLEELDSYIRDVEILGAIMGEPERAAEIIEYYQTRYSEVEARHNEDTSAPSVMFIYYSTKGGTTSFMSPGADWLQTTVTSVAGGDPLSLELEGTGWNTVSLEQIIQWNPEIIFIVTYTDDPSCEDVKEMLMSGDLWQGVEAVQNERVYSVPDDCFGTATVGSWDTSGSRWILCLQWMEAKISGEDAGLMDSVESFYTNLYGLSEAQAQALIEAIVGDI